MLERECMEEMTSLNKVDGFENVDLVDAMPMPIQSISNVPFVSSSSVPQLSPSAPQTHGGAASVAHPLIRPIPNKFKMASLIWYEYKRYLQYVHNITSSTEMKNVKAIEDAGLITPAQNKQIREHKLVINEIKCRLRDERRQHPDL
ncbi:MAG: hypothetical protein J3Q66DRAFT_385310 [Benniella sp.]|nr:MAG: hypothetical protein J3Q66DRAFT_385310 [Benniella sp.]